MNKLQPINCISFIGFECESILYNWSAPNDAPLDFWSGIKGERPCQFLSWYWNANLRCIPYFQERKRCDNFEMKFWMGVTWTHKWKLKAKLTCTDQWIIQVVPIMVCALTTNKPNSKDIPQLKLRGESSPSF
jgi:hypothetical protein